jgi:2-polyprenyl-6-methoxyphenol hydroxylase-like FAD-dependent oxidoreductase
MNRILVVGAGLTGLATALFLARRGHAVELIEADAEAPPADQEARVATWSRRGVPQARQPHTFFQRSLNVLAEEAPDLTEALLAEGAALLPLGPPPLGIKMLYARRLMYEGILRRIAAAERGISIRAGQRVQGLLADQSRDPPHVTGVRLEGGEELTAELVVDCSGRWTQAPRWLAEIGVRPLREDLQETPLFYLTQWRRLKPGKDFSAGHFPIIIDLEYGEITVFPADNGWMALSFFLSMEDPLRSALRDPRRLEAVAAAVPAVQPWVEISDGFTEPTPLGRINNCARSLVDAAGPVVTGFQMVGDSANHTNPTRGRGVSLGFAHAQQLARTVEDAIADPIAHAVAFDQWTTDNIEVWFESQKAFDAALVGRTRCCLTGTQPAAPDPRFLEMIALPSLMETDMEAAVGFLRSLSLLTTPAELRQDPALGPKIAAFVASPGPPPPLSGPSRAEFERLVQGEAAAA